jgi:hypothetical protein
MNPITLIQEVYFDLTDLINGESYKSLGYDNRQDFLIESRAKLHRVETLLVEMQNEL